MPLEKDDPDDRARSDRWDEKYGGNPLYDKAARPIIHSVYHAGRAVKYDNPEEWAQAKDQLSKFGTGQSQTEYLQAHRKNEAHLKCFAEAVLPNNFKTNIEPKSVMFKNPSTCPNVPYKMFQPSPAPAPTFPTSFGTGQPKTIFRIYILEICSVNKSLEFTQPPK